MSMFTVSAIGERLRTQDNRITAHPIFLVQQLDRLYGMDFNRCDLAPVLMTETALQAVVAAEAINAQMAAMIREIDRAAAAADVYSSIEWALKRLRDEDMASRTGPLIDRMRRLLHAAGRTEEPFLRCEKGAAAFGWRTADGEDVDVAALSGGQEVLFRAAIAYAIVCTRAPEIRVLLVELAEASDGTTEQDVLRALLEVSDEIQVIVASCVPVEAPDGWTVIDVAARVQEVGS